MEMNAKFKERYDRVKKAVALEPVDRIPTMGAGPAAYPKFMGVKLSDYLSDMELNCTVNIQASEKFNVDGEQAPIFSPETFPVLWFSRPKIPGRELPEDELWQIDEQELIHYEDYDDIMKNGWEDWKTRFLAKNFPEFVERSAPYISYMPTAIKRHADAGFPTWVATIITTPFEFLCGGRTLAAFLMDDLMEDPDYLEEVMDKIHEENKAGYRAMFENEETRPLGVWVGGWRGTPSMINKEMFRRFSWKYLKDLAELCIEYDVIPIFHLDSNWTPGLEVFLEIEPKKAIVALDGKTDIYKAKEILGDRVCIMGDVPAEMLAFSTEEEVYNYSMKLIHDIGPTGFILCSGCDIPYNAKEENVLAMKRAIDDTAGKLY